MTQPSSGDVIIEEITIKSFADRVFIALTSPEQRMKWWGAEGRFKVTEMESDLRPSGKWFMRGIGMGGKPFIVHGVYREIERPRLLTFTWNPSWQSEPLESLVRFDLDEKQGITTVRLTHSGLVTEGSRAQHRGWPAILGWLQAYLEQGD
jgi:uncharacterized protein YndB with AHSA1/START domain